MSNSKILDVTYAYYGDNDQFDHNRFGPQKCVRLDVRLRDEALGVRLNADRFGFHGMRDETTMKRVMTEEAIREMVRYFEHELRQALIEQAAIKNPRPIIDAF